VFLVSMRPHSDADIYGKKFLDNTKAVNIVHWRSFPQNHLADLARFDAFA
jgi:hypothetical protein